MSDVKKITPDVENAVTEADVVEAFTNAEKTLMHGTADVNDNTVETSVDSGVLNEQGNEDACTERDDFVKHFKMNFTLDDIPDAEGMIEDETPPVVEQEIAAPADKMIVSPLDEDKKETEDEEKTNHYPSGCLTRLIIALLVVILSVSLATVITTAIFDVGGFSRNNREAEVYIPEGANTEKVASILKKEGMINSERYFCWYVRFMKLDNKWREGSFTLQADMGFPNLVNAMQAKPPRKTVMVTFPEGMTVPEMAELLEEKGVCDADSFINAVRYGDFDYDFVRDIPTEADDPMYANRAYRLEGYLFPDTYEFYLDSLGETVVDRMLQNFEARISKEMIAQIKDNGWTLDQAVIFASMVQAEGDTRVTMDKVSRVLHNRLDKDSGFTLLQLCSTRDYANYLLDLKWDSYEADTLKQAYNTYYREGFPVGAICNPGLDAFNAVLYPSVDENIMKCYYFATDYKTGITYFSKTAKEHAAVIKKYGIEDIG